MINGLAVSFPVPCMAVIVVKQNKLPSVKRLATVLPSTTPDAHPGGQIQANSRNPAKQSGEF